MRQSHVNHEGSVRTIRQSGVSDDHPNDGIYSERTSRQGLLPIAVIIMRRYSTCVTLRTRRIRIIPIEKLPRDNQLSRDSTAAQVDNYVPARVQLDGRLYGLEPRPLWFLPAYPLHKFHTPSLLHLCITWAVSNVNELNDSKQAKSQNGDTSQGTILSNTNL